VQLSDLIFETHERVDNGGLVLTIVARKRSLSRRILRYKRPCLGRRTVTTSGTSRDGLEEPQSKKGQRKPAAQALRLIMIRSKCRCEPAYCPTGLFIGISVLAPQGFVRVVPLLLRTTNQVASDGRHTAKSALPSPS
jgi:hypothetical protein